MPAPHGSESATAVVPAEPEITEPDVATVRASRPHQRHLDRLRAIKQAAATDREASRGHVRGEAGQRARRAMEASLRRRALAAVLRGTWAGDDPRHVAMALACGAKTPGRKILSHFPALLDIRYSW